MISHYSLAIYMHGHVYFGILHQPTNSAELRIIRNQHINKLQFCAGVTREAGPVNRFRVRWEMAQMGRNYFAMCLRAGNTVLWIYGLLTGFSCIP